MCHFITAICSEHTKLADINAIGKNYSLEFVECNNEYITKQILKKEKYLYKVSKMCDCGTSLGEASTGKPNPDRIKKSEIDKLQKKGWSDSKINRYLSDKKKSEDKVAQQNEQALNRPSNELENYVNFIQELFMNTNIETFGFLLHWYSEGIENENIKLSDRKTIFFKDLTVLDLKTVEEDSLLCLKKYPLL
jgi:hypothetical protein